ATDDWPFRPTGYKRSSGIRTSGPRMCVGGTAAGSRGTPSRRFVLADKPASFVPEQAMNYWLNLFTAKTWKEFRAPGGKTTGFREHTWSRAKSIRPGDIFLCYLVGVKRWVGLLELASERYKDDSRIYEEEVFPVRFSVTPLAMLDPEQGVPMESLAGKL